MWAAALLLASPALADTPPRPVAVFGLDHPDCLEWSDGCVVCRRLPDGEAACSTAGAACLASAPACVKPKP